LRTDEVREVDHRTADWMSTNVGTSTWRTTGVPYAVTARAPDPENVV